MPDRGCGRRASARGVAIHTPAAGSGARPPSSLIILDGIEVDPHAPNTLAIRLDLARRDRPLISPGSQSSYSASPSRRACATTAARKPVAPGRGRGEEPMFMLASEKCFGIHIWPFLDSDVTAAWVQAVGSILAIGAAIWSRSTNLSQRSFAGESTTLVPRANVRHIGIYCIGHPGRSRNRTGPELRGLRLSASQWLKT